MAHWFDGARFGMFVHWNHASVGGWELSWPLVGGTRALPYSTPVPIDEYYAAAESFRPDRDSPRRWIDLAQRAGMRYAVLTTKHHDGFALFDTKHSDFSAARGAYGGDIVGEFAEATREAGLRVGFYYSLSDWHHPDYPAFTEADKPYAFTSYRRPGPEAWERYLAFLFGQVRELLTNYGPVDVMWFDGGWERSPKEWRAKELEAMIRELQPGILINDRLPSVGDYVTPEQFIPSEAPGKRWETCMTMNRTWGWCPADDEWKSARELVHTLCEVAGRGGNLLLNVSPMANGALPSAQVERLETVAQWMQRHADAIHDTDAGLAPWQFYGPSTRRGHRVFLIALMRPYEGIVVRGVPIRRIESARVLGSDVDLAVRTRAPVLDELFNSDPEGEAFVEVPEELVDPYATIIEVALS